MIRSFAPSPAPVKPIHHVQFGILSPEQITKMAAMEVTSGDNFVNNRPKSGGLSDPRLGPLDSNQKCQTCGSGQRDCPGHFGYLKLALPVFHIGFMAIITKVLRCVCYKCGKALCNPLARSVQEILQKESTPQQRLRDLAEVCTKEFARCGVAQGRNTDGPSVELTGCGALQPKYRRNGLKLTMTIPAEGEDVPQRTVIRTASEVHELFSMITDEDCRMLGLAPEWARPNWLVMTVFPIPPPAVRPSVIDKGRRTEDDLTFLLSKIVKSNESLKQMLYKNEPQLLIAEGVDLLQNLIANYINNETPSVPSATTRDGKRPFKTLSQRLKGKEGRLRGNLMGKRVDFTARTVITADPNLSVDEVGVPRSIAATLTYPEVVTPYNIEALAKLVRAAHEKGVDNYPSARRIIRLDNQAIDLRFAQDLAQLHLEYGYVVERHLQNGDIVVFNRQPSLHKMSMMGHRVRVMPWSTFRLNLSVTTPYNADFDGDEMNLHVPQSLNARAEVEQLAMVPRNIVAPASNFNVMGIVQDALLGTSLFTKRDTFLTKDLAMHLLMHVMPSEKWKGLLPVPAILKPTPLWTGKQIFSLFLPNVTITGQAATHDDEVDSKVAPDMSVTDSAVIIHSGQLLAGMICKKNVGVKSRGGLIHVIWNEFGPLTTRDFMNTTQRVVNNWLLQRGFSVGISDMLADEKTDAVIRQILDKAEAGVSAELLNARSGKLESLPGLNMMETFEHNVNSILNKAVGEAGQQAKKTLRYDNRLKLMVEAGSKGSETNIAQIVACVGQQNVEGKRIPYGFRRRTLPHFVKDDHGPTSRGFVTSSFIHGLSPSEFFFHAMGGREGVIDTAVKTARTGYIQRRLVKAMESVMVKYDGTVRNSSDTVIQFLYGEDGLDATRVEWQTMPSVTLSPGEFERRYKYSLAELNAERYESSPLKKWLSSAAFDDLQTAETRALLDEEFRVLQADRDTMREKHLAPSDMVALTKNALTAKLVLPVNIERIVRNASKQFAISTEKPSDLTPSDAKRRLDALADQLVVLFREDPESMRVEQANATALFKMHLRACLASKKILMEYHLSSEALDHVLGEIRMRFFESLAQPGEMVGSLAAQSIGEPATQMTLNTFHFAGVSAKNATLGVPRLEELINVSTANKTPMTNVYLRRNVFKDKEAASRVRSQLQRTTLQHIAKMTEIWYDPNPEESIIAEDADFLADHCSQYRDEVKNLSPWVLRIQLDLSRWTKAGEIDVARIGAKIREAFSNTLYVITSREALCIHVRIVYTEAERTAAQAVPHDVFLRTIESSLMAMILSGYKEISKVFLDEEHDVEPDPDPGKEGTYRLVKGWMLKTDGIDLRNILAHPDVESTRTVSNSVVEVLEIMGIEAARAVLLNEVKAVLSFDNGYINYRHMAVLADAMTYRGMLLPITRHGVNRIANGALMRASFEETVDVLLQAAAYGEIDDCQGVSETIMLGQLSKLGTGSFDLFLDEQLLQQAPEHSLMHTGYGADAGSQYLPLSPSAAHGAMTPYASTPSWAGGDFGGARSSPHVAFSPVYEGGGASPLRDPSSNALFSVLGGRGGTHMTTEFLPTSPQLHASPSHGGYQATSPLHYSPSSPAHYSPTSPAHPGTQYTPTSPHAAFASSGGKSPASPMLGQRAAFGTLGSQNYSPASPQLRTSPTSPAAYDASPQYTPSSPVIYSPASPALRGTAYSPSSPTAYNYEQTSPENPAYSPSSPVHYSPTSPVHAAGAAAYSPTSPQQYSPTSPQQYSPTSPQQQQYSPTSPQQQYSPTSPQQQYSPTSPQQQYSPTSPQQQYSPTSPQQQYSPTSPQQQYSPTSPQAAHYSPSSSALPSGLGSGAYAHMSPAMMDATPYLSPSSPRYISPLDGHPSNISPASPVYSFSPVAEAETASGLPASKLPPAPAGGKK